MNIIKNAGLDFDSMISLAKNSVSEASNCEFNQCVVVKTANKNLLIHRIVTNSVDELVKEQCRIVTELATSLDTEVEKIICMWDNNSLEVPSHDFMQSLCELNSKNKDARIVLNSGKIFRIADIITIIYMTFPPLENAESSTFFAVWAWAF